MRNTEIITILIADSHTLNCDLYTFFLNSDPRLRVIAEARDRMEALRIANNFKPRVVVMDTNMISEDGKETFHEISKCSPGSRMVVIGADNISAHASRFLRLGAWAYVSRKSNREELLYAIVNASQGQKYICAETKINFSYTRNIIENPEERLSSLTRREASIAHLVRIGLPSKIIASQLGISVKTVEVHRYHILKKLNVKNTATLVNYLNINGI